MCGVHVGTAWAIVVPVPAATLHIWVMDQPPPKDAPDAAELVKRHDSLWERVVVAYIIWLQRWRIIVGVLCVALLAGSAVLAPKLLDATTNAYNPPHNTEAYTADKILGEYFPRVAETCSLGIRVELANVSKVGAAARRQSVPSANAKLSGHLVAPPSRRGPACPQLCTCRPHESE